MLHDGFSGITDIQYVVYAPTRARAPGKAMVWYMMANNNIFAKSFIIFIQPITAIDATLPELPIMGVVCYRTERKPTTFGRALIVYFYINIMHVFTVRLSRTHDSE
jgi:hypothetical protein